MPHLVCDPAAKYASETMCCQTEQRIGQLDNAPQRPRPDCVIHSGVTARTSAISEEADNEVDASSEIPLWICIREERSAHSRPIQRAIRADDVWTDGCEKVRERGIYRH
jgi:hypothetical protein